MAMKAAVGSLETRLCNQIIGQSAHVFPGPSFIQIHLCLHGHCQKLQAENLLLFKLCCWMVGWLAVLMELTFAALGCQASRHRDLALLTSLVFCIRDQLFTCVWMEVKKIQDKTETHNIQGQLI